MEGLIPFVIHAIKKSRERSKYLSLSDDSSHASGRAGLLWQDKEGSSRHRRTRSEFQPRLQGSDYLHHGGYDAAAQPPSDLHQRRALAPSRSLGDGALSSAAASRGGARGAAGVFW